MDDEPNVTPPSVSGDPGSQPTEEPAPPAPAETVEEAPVEEPAPEEPPAEPQPEG